MEAGLRILELECSPAFEKRWVSLGEFRKPIFSENAAEFTDRKEIHDLIFEDNGLFRGCNHNQSLNIFV
jgi:hypothetical protein